MSPGAVLAIHLSVAEGNRLAPVVECVPNFSEGRDPLVIDAIVRMMQSIPGQQVLHVDRGHAAHRTVVTLAGEPDAVADAVLAGAAVALDRIDLQAHDGVHPRLGVVDVVPFVPLQGVQTPTCVALARRVGQQLGDQFGVPVYLYGHAASAPDRRNLARLRRGQARALPKKLARLPPDFGPQSFHPGLSRCGASVVGARDLLVAWNVTLNCDDSQLARDIAACIRETAPTGLPFVRAIGWSIAEYGRAQVSTNLLDWRVTSPHQLTAAVTRLARARGVDVDGSELVGMIPEEALLADSAPMDGPVTARLAAAADHLGLHHLGAVDLDQVVLERRLPRLRGGVAGVD